MGAAKPGLKLIVCARLASRLNFRMPATTASITISSNTFWLMCWFSVRSFRPPTLTILLCYGGLVWCNTQACMSRPRVEVQVKVASVDTAARGALSEVQPQKVACPRASGLGELKSEGPSRMDPGCHHTSNARTWSRTWCQLLRSHTSEDSPKGRQPPCASDHRHSLRAEHPGN